MAEFNRKAEDYDDIGLFKSMKDYNILILDTHGQALCPAGDRYKRCPCGSLAPPGAVVVTSTGTLVTTERNRKYALERREGEIVGSPYFTHYGITPKFVSQYAPYLSDTLVWNGSCRSLYNSSMANGFLSRGAATYFGYNEYVGTPYDGSMVTSIFTPLLKGVSAGQAYDEAFRVHGTSLNPNCPETRAVLLILGGKPDVKIIVDGINNGSFEQGPGSPPPGWDATGDVQIITKLGPITAKEGLYMAYLSTGENAEEQSRSTLEQPFCVPADAKKVSFDYRLVSEEPDEFLNSGYRDTFEASVVVGSTRTVLVSEHTDQAPWNPVTGIDLEGGDRTAFATDWKRVSGDLPEAARTEGATLAFRLQDNGDRVYDTVALVDNVHLE